jgi:hypothetical protein
MEFKVQKKELKWFLFNYLKIELAKKYIQDSIGFKYPDSDRALLIGTSESGFPGLGIEDDIGLWHPDRIAKYFSRLRTKKEPFTFTKEGDPSLRAECTSIKYLVVNREFKNKPDTMGGWEAVHLMSNKKRTI